MLTLNYPKEAKKAKKVQWDGGQEKDWTYNKLHTQVVHNQEIYNECTTRKGDGNFSYWTFTICSKVQSSQLKMRSKTCLLYTFLFPINARCA